MKPTRSFLFAAFVARSLASAGLAATTSVSLTAADWVGLQQQVPPIAQEAYLKASLSSVGAYFGWSVAASGDTVVIGSPFGFGDPLWAIGNAGIYSPFRTGAALVFVRDGTNWTQQAYLRASNAGSNDWFGVSVAISGDTIVVGAEAEGSSARGVNGDQDNDSARQSGAAYVFVRNGTNWTQQAYLKASNTQGISPTRFEGAFFGHSVAVSGDTAAVGALWEGSNATGVNGDQDNYGARVSGAVYVFERTGTNWAQQAYVKASNPGVGDDFGASVSLSGDTLVVGAPMEDSNATGVNGDQTNNSAVNSGAAYVFTRSGTNWSQQAYLKASNPDGSPPTFPPPFPPLPVTGDEFGHSVSVSGDIVVVGALYEDSNASGINGNQNDNSTAESGAAYIFVRNGATWSQQAYLKASNAEANDHFGISVAASGETVVVGAHGESSSATGVNGDSADNSVAASGAAYVFVRTGTNWSQQAYLKASNAGWSDRLGVAVAISGDTVVAGAIGESSHATGVNGDQSDNSVRESGAAYVFSGVGIPPDSDGDGVIDAVDRCPNTPIGVVVDASGCSIGQLVSCDGPWRDHGEYVQALFDVTRRFTDTGLITESQRRAILREGLASDCGKRRKP